MNTLQTHWSKFKQEYISILYVSIIQIWFNFKFPAFIKLGTPLNTIVSLSCSIATTLCYMIVFSHANIYLSQYNLEGSNNTQEKYKKTAQKALQIGLFIWAHILFFYMWRHNYYDMSAFFYALFYVHCLTVFLLIARAITRQPFY